MFHVKHALPLFCLALLSGLSCDPALIRFEGAPLSAAYHSADRRTPYFVTCLRVETKAHNVKDEYISSAAALAGAKLPIRWRSN